VLPKISTSTVLKQTKIIDPLFIFEQRKKRQLKKLRFQKTDNLFRGKIKIDSFIFHLENIFSIYLPKVIW
jgi:hypothetical protein